MNLRYSFLLTVMILAIAGCATDEKSSLDMRTMTATLDGKEISLDAFQAYLEDETHGESAITVEGLNEVEMEMKPHEITSACIQISEDLSEYYFPEGGVRSPPDDSYDPENPFQSNEQNQRVDPIVETPVELEKIQGTAGHP